MQPKQDSDQKIHPYSSKFARLDQPYHINRIIKVIAFVCAGLFVMDIILPFLPVFDFHSSYGAYCLFGFLIYGSIVLASKYLRKLIMRDENYYESVTIDSETHPDHDLQVMDYRSENKKADSLE